MSEIIPATAPGNKPSGVRASQLLLIVVGTILVTSMVTFWFARAYIYASDFKPVELDAREQGRLDAKLRVLGYEPAPSPGARSVSDAEWLRPEPYAEDTARREVMFSERELNALIANDRSLARKLAVDLSHDLVSARLLVPLDPDFPLLGGKTLRLSAGAEMALSNGRPKVVLKGVSLMGVPLPAAWLGGLKNIDLISEFGDAGGFWQGFTDGVEDISVREGQLRVRLKP